MPITTKRIINLDTAASTANDDYIVLDGTTNGTRKYATSGKGLSKNDYTDAEKADVAKIDGIETEVTGIRTGYNGTVYNSAGDAVRGQISDLKDNLNLKADKAVSTSQIDFSITKNKYLDSNGDEVSANNYAILTADLTNISGYLRICSYAGYTNAKYAFYNANNVVIKKATISGAEVIVVEDVEIPTGAVKIKVGGRTVKPYSMPKVCQIEYLDTMADSNGGVFSKLLIPNEYTEIDYSWTDGGFYFTDNAFYETNAAHFTVINVVAGEFYHIVGENDYYFNAIGYSKSALGSTVTWIPNASNAKYIDMVLQIPHGVDCLIVQGDSSKTTVIEKATGFADARIFVGKKIAIIGDSTVEKNATASKKWHDNIALETGLEVVNLGISGTGYKNGEDINKAYYQRLSSVPADCDAVIIFGSGNDNLLTIGTVTDATTDTVCGCVNKTINDLISLYPTIKIGVITAYPWRSYKPSTSNYMGTIAENIVAICRGNSIPILDLYHCSNLRPWIPENDSALFYNADGCHINNDGHAIITPMILEFLKTLLTSN